MLKNNAYFLLNKMCQKSFCGAKAPLIFLAKIISTHDFMLARILSKSFTNYFIEANDALNNSKIQAISY